MSVIDLKDLENYYLYSNFEKYDNKKARFSTKIASSIKHNGEIVDVIGMLKGRDSEHNTYIVKFNDDTIEENIMNIELSFDYIKDPVHEDTRRKLSQLFKKYDLTNDEIEKMQVAVSNYDYEANEGIVFSSVDSIIMLFNEESNSKKIEPSKKQLKAMAEYIEYTKDYYMLYGYEEYTKKIILDILNENDVKISKTEFLNEIKEMIEHNIMCYSEDYASDKAKLGFEKEHSIEKQKLEYIKEIIEEEKQKQIRKKSYKEAR